METVRALELSHWHYAQKQRILQPVEIPCFTAKTEAAQRLLGGAKQEQRDLLPHEAAQFLQEYGVPVVQGIPVVDEEWAVNAAKKLGFPVAMKIISQQISHKSDVGGVQLNLRTEAGVAEAYRDMTQRIQKAYPEARELAADETGLIESDFPRVCPYSDAAILDNNFLPE